MAFEFRLPDIGEGLTEAEVIEWLVEPGQEVKLDQPLVRMETDKAVTDIPSPRAGVLLRQGAPAGETLSVGELLAVIGAAGEVPPPEETPAGRDGSASAPRPAAAPIVGTLQEAEDRPGAPSAPRALPLVRRLAGELNVDLQNVEGSGPGGQITREDVERAASGASPNGPSERVRLSKLRRTIAERMSRSWREIPHVTTFGHVDATRLTEVRRQWSEQRGRTVPLEALFVAAVLPALRDHPDFNASLDGDDLILKGWYDIGVAVDTPDGLIVPVIRGADRLDPPALADEVLRLGKAARSRTAAAEDLTGATFTISNIGAVGGGYGTPIIPYGTTAILSFGRAEDIPVARSGSVEVAPMLPLSLSYDHRVIDGALGRRFLAEVIRHLEDPAARSGIHPARSG